MEEKVLTDETQFPAEEIIYSYIGNTKILWAAVFEFIHQEYPGFSEEWRYYKDGKSWLLKVTRKAKTIFWLSVQKGTFIMTFYFTEKAKDAIINSSLSDELKTQFLDGKRFNKIRGITITFRNNSDIEFAKELIALKLHFL